MIINHNMNAMNAHRLMTGNTATAGKSMEKLSSGLRINKAGDDAAGLAISEKMRGQIRGLDQASRNSQDAISMIQTAEGALNETHSILQRMKELSTQAANGTLTDSDRSEIQKEMNQLTSEVNRIGNTTEFNTKKLLQGSTSKSDLGATAGTAVDGKAAVAGTQADWVSDALTALTNGQSGTVTFKGVTLTITAATGTGVPSTITDVTKNSATIGLDLTSDATHDEQLAVIKNAFDQIKAQTGSDIADFDFSVNTTAHKLVIKDSLSNGDANNSATLVGTGDLSTLSGAGKTHTNGVDAIEASAATNTLTFGKVPTEGSTINVAGKQVAFYDSSKSTFKNAEEATTNMNADYVIDVNNKNTSQIAAEVASKFSDASGLATASAVGNAVTFTSTTLGGNKTDNVEITTQDAYAGTKSKYTADAAVGSADLSSTNGDSFQLKVVVGDKAYTVDSSKLNVDLTGINTFGSTQQQTVIDALNTAVDSDGNKLSDVVNVSFDGTTLNLESKNVGTDKITTVLTGSDAAAVDTALGITAGTVDGSVVGTKAIENNGKTFEESFQVGANNGQSFNISINDMRGQALNISGTSAGETHSEVAGAKFTAIKSVTNGTDNTATEYALDVSAPEAASAAIKVLDNAIQNVSAERSKLGAYQNRLEHTIANLGTSSENLTAAESRIRDVDMAKEMMNFSKNNILSQAAQAMLAQANQQPQGVLQLLR